MIRISKTSTKAIIQYLMLLLIWASGGMQLMSVVGTDAFVFIVLLASILVFCYCGSMPKRLFNLLICYFVVAFLTTIWSSLSIGTILNLASTVLMIHAACCVDPEMVERRFLKISMIFIYISIIMFLLIRTVGVGIVSPLLFFESGQGEQGFFLYVYSDLHQARNCGPYGEPGKYQIVLCCVLYILLFRSEYIEKKKLWLAATLFAIITCQSTNGYIGAALILISLLLSKNRADMKEIRRPLLILLILAIVFMTCTQLGREFFSRTIGNKLFVSGQLDLNQNTSAERMVSIYSVINYIKNNPISIFGIGYESLQSSNIEACAGLFGLFLATGIGVFSILYGYLIRNIVVYHKSVFDIIAQFVLIVSAGLGQPNIFPAVVAFTIILSGLSKPAILHKSK